MKELPDSILPLHPRDQRNLYEKLSHALLLAEPAPTYDGVDARQKILSIPPQSSAVSQCHPGETLLAAHGSQAASENEELSVEIQTWVHHDIYGVHRYDIDPKRTSEAWHIYQDPEQQSLPMIDQYLNEKYILHTYISREQGHMLDEIAEMALRSLTR